MNTIALNTVQIGQQIIFDPVPDQQTATEQWFVKARDERYIIAELSDASNPTIRGYCVIDTNPAPVAHLENLPPAPVRSSLDTLGGGYDLSQPDWAETMLAQVNDGTYQLSRRRSIPILGITVDQD